MNPACVEQARLMLRVMPLVAKENCYAERLFLVSLKMGEPDWKLLDVPGADKLPAIQWKLQNIRKMDAGKRREQIEWLKGKLGL